MLFVKSACYPISKVFGKYIYSGREKNLESTQVSSSLFWKILKICYKYCQYFKISVNTHGISNYRDNNGRISRNAYNMIITLFHFCCALINLCTSFFFFGRNKCIYFLASTMYSYIFLILFSVDFFVDCPRKSHHFENSPFMTLSLKSV